MFNKPHASATQWRGEPLDLDGEQMCETRFVDFLPQKFGGVQMINYPCRAKPPFGVDFTNYKTSV